MKWETLKDFRLTIICLAAFLTLFILEGSIILIIVVLLVLSKEIQMHDLNERAKRMRVRHEQKAA